MPLTISQNASLQPIIQASAALSIVGSLAIIATYIGVESFRRPSNRLVFWVSVADLFAAICMFFAAWPITSFNIPAVCTIQGWGISFFLLSAMFWTACLSIQCLLAIRKGTKLEKLISLERWFHVISWGIPFILATVAIFLESGKLGPVYTDATLWCWIGGNYQSLRFYLFYMWLWAIFIFNLFVYAFVGYTLWKSQKKLAAYGKEGGSDEPWQPSRSMRIYVRKTSFFIVAFFINWFPGSLNRIQNMISPNDGVYALFLLHSIFTPLQGFLNFIAYFLVHYLFKSSNGKQMETTDSTTRDDSSTGGQSYGNNHNAVHYTAQDVSNYMSKPTNVYNGPDYGADVTKSNFNATGTAPSSDPMYGNSYSVYSPARTQTVATTNSSGSQPYQNQPQYQSPYQPNYPAMTQTQNTPLSPVFSPSFQASSEPQQPNYSSAAAFQYSSPQYR